MDLTLLVFLLLLQFHTENSVAKLCFLFCSLQEGLVFSLPPSVRQRGRESTGDWGSRSQPPLRFWALGHGTRAEFHGGIPHGSRPRWNRGMESGHKRERSTCRRESTLPPTEEVLALKEGRRSFVLRVKFGRRLTWVYTVRGRAQSGRR